jgi:TPR repeat protein
MKTLVPACPATGLTDANACFLVGSMHHHGRGTRRDPVKARGLYRQGCTAGGGDACHALGDALTRGTGGDVDTAGATAAYERACGEFDHGKACEVLATGLINANKGTEPRAKQLAERACQLDPKTCGALGRLLGYVLYPRDEAGSTRYYKLACDSGGLGWCLAYAYRAYEGLGGPKDIKSVGRALERACDGAHVEACARAGEYLADVDGVKASRLAEFGCSYKDGPSCYRVGWLAHTGKSGSKDLTRAFTYYEKACEYEHVGSCDLLGDAYYQGSGTTKDLTKAIAAYKKGCDGVGKSYDATACGSYARMAYLGEGMAKDAKLAVTVYQKACKGGAKGACGYLVAIAREAQIPLTEVTSAIDDACRAKNEDACAAFAEIKIASEQETDRRAGYEAVAASCGRRHATACLRQADLLVAGRGVAKDVEAARKIYRTQCDAGSMGGCFGYGYSLDREKKDHEEANRYLLRACEGNFADACWTIGYRYYANRGMRWDAAEAVKFFAKACELGSTAGCASYAELMFHGIGIAVDHKKSFALYKQYCVPPDFFGCHGYGRYLATGAGGVTAIDKKAAAVAYRKTCESENALAESCSDLAALLEQANGNAGEIARLRTKALASVKKSADEGFPYYMYLLGNYHRDGVATVKDPVKALEWFGKACDGYEVLGCMAAGKALLATGKAPDADRARVYLERACAASVAAACNMKAPAPGPKPVAKGKGGCCGGEVAPGAELPLAMLVLGLLVVRSRRARRA